MYLGCVGEQEFRALSPEELKACQDGCKPGACKVADLDRQLLQQLYKKGLVHLDVPIRPNDHVSIPPLEVSCLCLLQFSGVCIVLCLQSLTEVMQSLHRQCSVVLTNRRWLARLET